MHRRPIRTEQDIQDGLREIRAGLTAKLANLQAKAGHHPAFLAEETQRLRAEALAEARAFEEALAGVTLKRATLAGGLPGVDEGAERRMVDMLRRHAKASGDPAAYARTATADLDAQLAAATDPLVVSDISQELRFRVEQGTTGLEALLHRAERRLAETIDAMPDTVRRRAEYDRLTRIEENCRYTMQAIETGTEDLGVISDRHAEVSARVASGEWTKDQARQALNGLDPTPPTPAAGFTAAA